MKATLLTRCGCEREMEISAPANPTILIPLRTQNSWFHLTQLANDDITRPSFGIRRFSLYSIEDNHARYIEESPR